MFDPGAAGDGTDCRARLEQGGPDADRCGAAGQQDDIGRDYGRRVDQPKACHAQHTMNEIGGDIAFQVLVDETRIVRQRLFVGAGGGRIFIRIARRTQCFNNRRSRRSGS